MENWEWLLRRFPFRRRLVEEEGGQQLSKSLDGAFLLLGRHLNEDRLK